MKKKIVAIALLFITVLSLIFTVGCSTTPKVRSYLFYDLFDTVCEYKDYSGVSEKEFNERCKRIEEEVSLCHKLFDIYHDYEGIINLKTINDNAGRGAMVVDERIIELLMLSQQVWDLSGGDFNVCMGAVLSIWHGYREDAEKNPNNARLPKEEELRAAAEHISATNLIISPTDSTVELLDPEMSLDVGAIAKGYAAERVAGMLSDMGVTAYVLDFGGNIRVGEKTDGAHFTAGIRNPNPYDTEPYVRTAEVKNCALVTSAVDQRFYTVNGVRYHHIINKDTLMPENNYLSVSIMTGSSAMADALSTALFNMTVDEGQALINRIGGVEVTYVMNDYTVKVISSS